jgi:sugar lactone lactonase YvrE
LLVTDSGASRVYRVTLQPLSLKLFASGSLFQTPEAIASGPDGTVYVVNVGSQLDPQGRSIVKITPAGVASVFARAKDTTARRMLAVDSEGTVFWSSATGIDRFKPDGTRLSPLPPPPDEAAFQNPMGAAFDAQDNLYVVENFGCKKIYKYTE